MSLYHEAAQVLDTADRGGGSLKSIVFGKKDWKSDPKALFALTTETVKWSEILSEVVQKSTILKLEKQLTPTLALLLAHDLLLSKKGIALPQKHGLHIALARHRARLVAELTKLRVRRKFATVDALRSAVNNGTISNGSEHEGLIKPMYLHPRWVRINTLRTSLDEQLRHTFADYEQTEDLGKITNSQSGMKVLYIDTNIPDLIAIPASIELKNIEAHAQGKLILQDKASCFPAYLLNPSSEDGDLIDACAAPGNKTTHLAALSFKANSQDRDLTAKHRIIACERDIHRSQTLTNMATLARADDSVRVRANQDFLKLNPNAKDFSKVTALLLDPSCSGSGIVGRDDVNVTIHLPNVIQAEPNTTRTKKRKRDSTKTRSIPPTEASMRENVAEGVHDDLEENSSKLEARLSALSAFQLRLLEHAMTFPAAERIAYSTCSIYSEENEHVVVKALVSEAAVGPGWRIMKREKQVDGLQKWHTRGNREAIAEVISNKDGHKTRLDVEVIADSCIRCAKGSKDGTMGFFVAGFVRDSKATKDSNRNHTDRIATSESSSEGKNEDENVGEEWNGFRDEDM